MLEKISKDLVETLKNKNITISFAESCTGGLMASALVYTAGASSVFEYGFVTYSAKSKTDVLNVSPSTIESHGIVSKEVALEMAQGALDKSGACVSVSVTGCAGPDKDLDGNLPGEICFGFAIKNKIILSEKTKIDGASRNEIRKNAVIYAFSRIIEIINQSLE